MEYTLDGSRLIFNRELSELDELVLKFVSLFNNVGIKYVVISGYVAILFGRTRTTEDVDIFIEVTDSATFGKFFDELGKNGLWLINGDGKEEAFEILNEHLPIRIAKIGEAVPNFEIKLPKKETDFMSLNKPLEVIINDRHLNVSPFEIQIPFKLWLGSDKDIEDATHVYELFKDKLNKELMHNIAKRLGVEKKMVEYGFE
ncbi:MAG: hypothetical protein KGI06_04575 [Candidatus Micrarchaeota archaeon]|nr:hypothetical protein [Candidatus Micrarchaeota archaeon]